MITIPESRRVAEHYQRRLALGCTDQPKQARSYRKVSITEKLKAAAMEHPLNVDLHLFSLAAARIEELEAKLARLQSASRAMRQEIVDRIEPDAEGFQPYDGDQAVWTEFCEAMEAAKV